MRTWILVMSLSLGAHGLGLAQEEEDFVDEEVAISQPVSEVSAAEWKSNAGINGILSTGNSENLTIGAQGLVSWKLNRNQVESKGEGNYGRSTDPATGVKSTNTKNWRTSLRYDRFISDPISFFGLGNIGADQPAGFDLRYGGSVGFSHAIWRTDPNFFKYEIGYDLVHEDRVTPPNETIHSTRVFAQYKRDFSKHAAFSQDVEALFNMQDKDDVRLNTLTALTVKLTNIVAFRTGFQVTFDNVPVPGKKKTDTTTQVGLVFDLI